MNFSRIPLGILFLILSPIAALFAPLIVAQAMTRSQRPWGTLAYVPSVAKHLVQGPAHIGLWLLR